MSSTGRRRSSPWGVGLVVAVVVPVLVFAFQQGQCFDAAADAGDGVCSSGPSVGWPGAWLITAACVVLLLVCLRRLIRPRRTHR